MAGFLKTAMQQAQEQAPRQPPEQMPDQMDDEQDEQPNVTPEEQALYEKVVYNAMNVIHQKETSQHILEMIQSAESPVEGVAQASVNVADQIYQKAQQQGVAIPDEALAYAADDIIDMVVELAQAGGVVKEFTDDDKFMAATRALELWKQLHPELVDEEQQKQDFNNLDRETMRRVVGKLGVAA